MKKSAMVLAAAAICFVGPTGVSLAADNYYSCVRESVTQCRYIHDEWESCSELNVGIVDMCRSLYPRKGHR
jgi:hypothetical protein